MLKTWKQVRSEVLAKKYGKELRQVFFINPTTEKEEEFYLIGQRDWAVILPLTKDGFVVTVRQYKQGCDKIIHELPAGTKDQNRKNIEEVAENELLDETGYKPEKMIFLGPPLWMSSRNSWTQMNCFLALGCEKIQAAKIDTSEEIETELVAWSKWLTMCQGEIEEPSAVVATFRAMPYIKQ